MRTERRRQRDLFDSRRPLREMMPVQRAKVTALLQALLIEAAAERAAESQDTVGEEVRDDEDRS
jgi:alkylhydroperoxidase family enzyme